MFISFFIFLPIRRIVKYENAIRDKDNFVENRQNFRVSTKIAQIREIFEHAFKVNDVFLVGTKNFFNNKNDIENRYLLEENFN